MGRRRVCLILVCCVLAVGCSRLVMSETGDIRAEEASAWSSSDGAGSLRIVVSNESSSARSLEGIRLRDEGQAMGFVITEVGTWVGGEVFRMPAPPGALEPLPKELVAGESVDLMVSVRIIDCDAIGEPELLADGMTTFRASVHAPFELILGEEEIVSTTITTASLLSSNLEPGVCA